MMNPEPETPRRPLDLGLLEFSDLDLDAVFEVAKLVDQLGFRRQGTDPACPSSVLLSSMVAGLTENIRVGTAGVLLRYLSPWAAVADAMTLGNVFPGRIDLGLAAAAVPEAHAALFADGRTDLETDACFEEKVRLVARQVNDRSSGKTADASSDCPLLWLLGTSGRRARLAAENGLGYCISLCHDPKSPPAPEVFEIYRRAFRATPLIPKPMCAVLLSLVCAETESEAKAILAAKSDPYLSLACGSDGVADLLDGFRERYGVDEIVIRDACPNLAMRLRSLSFIAQAA